MNELQSLYTIRGMRVEDENFIYATFLRGVYYGNSWFEEIPKDIFMIHYKRVAEELLKGTKTVVQVACLKEDPSIILGYSILSNDFKTIAWVYVKDKWRKKGIGRSLVPASPQSVANLTEVGKRLLNKFEIKPIFNPFSLGGI